MKYLLAAILLLTLTGCTMSRGFDRNVLREHVSQPATATDIQAVLNLKPQLPYPFKLAIYVHSPELFQRKPFWTELEKNSLQNTAATLKQSGVISDVVFIADSVVQHDSEPRFNLRTGLHAPMPRVSELRLAAARYGADALLTVNGISSTDRYNNVWSLSYWTIVGAYFVPGTHSDALVMISGVLWDVRNEYLYATEEAEGGAQKRGPALVLEDVDVIRQAKQVALTEFNHNLTARLLRLNGNTP